MIREDFRIKINLKAIKQRKTEIVWVVGSLLVLITLQQRTDSFRREEGNQINENRSSIHKRQSQNVGDRNVKDRETLFPIECDRLITSNLLFNIERLFEIGASKGKKSTKNFPEISGNCHNALRISPPDNREFAI